MCSAMPNVFMDAGHPNLDSHACTQSTPRFLLVFLPFVFFSFIPLNEKYLNLKWVLFTAQNSHHMFKSCGKITFWQELCRLRKSQVLMRVPSRGWTPDCHLVCPVNPLTHVGLGTGNQGSQEGVRPVHHLKGGCSLLLSEGMTQLSPLWPDHYVPNRMDIWC